MIGNITLYQVAETWETVETGIPFTLEKINAKVYKNIMITDRKIMK
ncbi:MAG: hypothetical protein ACOWWR_16700 [Eubacteriales bacterium]